MDCSMNFPAYPTAVSSSRPGISSRTRRPKAIGSATPTGRAVFAAVAIEISWSLGGEGSAPRVEQVRLPLDGGDHVEANEQGERKRKRDGINVERDTALGCGRFWHGTLRWL